MNDWMIIDFLHLDILKYTQRFFLILDTYFLIPHDPLSCPSAFRCSLMIYDPRFPTTYLSSLLLPHA